MISNTLAQKSFAILFRIFSLSMQVDTSEIKMTLEATPHFFKFCIQSPISFSVPSLLMKQTMLTGWGSNFRYSSIAFLTNLSQGKSQSSNDVMSSNTFTQMLIQWFSYSCQSSRNQKIKDLSHPQSPIRQSALVELRRDCKPLVWFFPHVDTIIIANQYKPRKPHHHSPQGPVLLCCCLLCFLLQKQSESQSNLSLMNLIDHYGGCVHTKQQQSQEQKRGEEHHDANVPWVLLALKDRVALNFPDDYLNIVDCREMNHRSGKGGEFMLEYLQRKAYNRQYQFYFQVSFYQTLYLLSIRGTFIKNGLFVHLPSKERIMMTIRVLNNLNREINPLKLMVNQFSGDISLEHSSFIDANLADFRFKRNLSTLTYRIYFIIELMMKCRFIVLFYLEGDVRYLTKSQVEFADYQYMEEVEKRMASIQKNLVEICFKTYNQTQEIQSELRKKTINPSVQYLTEQAETIIGLFTTQKQQQPSVISKLANQNYKEQHIQAHITKQEEKFGFRINNKVDFLGVPDWQREDCGGYGIILAAKSKFKLLDQESPIKRQKDLSQLVFEEKIAMKIDKSSQKGNSRIASEKEIIRSIGHLSHPNIATYFYNAKVEENCLYSLWQQNSSLKHYISRMTNVSAYQMLQMMEQAAKGLYFLHKHNIVHVDFKPANIIVGRKFLIKLTDFGESLLLTKPVKRSQLSYTFPYASPEIFLANKFVKKDSKQSHITPQADVYSLGVTIYKCFFGDYIWGSRLKQYKSSRCSPFIIPCIVPESFRDAGQQRVAMMIAYLCLRCMEKQPEKRAKLPWVITILQECRQYLSSLHYR